MTPTPQKSQKSPVHYLPYQWLEISTATQGMMFTMKLHCSYEITHPKSKPQNQSCHNTPGQRKDDTQSMVPFPAIRSNVTGNTNSDKRDSVPEDQSWRCSLA